MDIMLVVMFIIYIGLMIVATRTRIFQLPAPVETTNIKIENMMKDADGTQLPIGRDQFEKFKATISRNADASMALVAVAITDAVFMLLGAWNNFGANVTLLCVAGLVAGFVYYKIMRNKRKKRIFVKGRDLFKMQLGYVLDTDSKSIDYIYKRPSGTYRKGTTEFHKVLIGIIGREGKPEAYLVDVDHITFQQVMKSGLCDVVTYNGNFVAACYLVQKKPKE